MKQWTVVKFIDAKGVGAENWSRMAGLCRYAALCGWRVVKCRLTQKEDFARAERIVGRSNVIGVVTSLPHRLVRHVAGDKPVVYHDCPEENVAPGCPYIRHDAVQTAHLVARELFSCGCGHFAFASAPGRWYWSLERGAAFEREVIARGADFAGTLPELRSNETRLVRAALKRWIRTLPRPCGIFAVHDGMARHVVSVCGELGIVVPDEVAVVGVDNNQTHCLGAHPTITSVVPDWESGSFMAAAALDAFAHGRPVAPRETFRPLGIIRRESTSRAPVRAEKGVLAAVERIRREACAGLTAADVVAAMPCSRRQAETLFRTVTGGSILEEIRRVRFEQARALLSATDFPLSVVANRCGYGSIPTFCREFRRLTGLTPEMWRQKNG